MEKVPNTIRKRKTLYLNLDEYLKCMTYFPYIKEKEINKYDCVYKLNTIREDIANIKIDFDEGYVKIKVNCTYEKSN